ncbi:MAG: hypothetical protein VKL39_23140 [Leptolyngbyaceae bacterium]|nr:hypothetical protein [Leptolyngbyaceae bacterium]
MFSIVHNLDGENCSSSPYEAMLRELEQRGLKSEKLSTPTAPEDLNSRHLFTHEQSREPGLYDAVLNKYEKYEKVHEAIRLSSYS